MSQSRKRKLRLLVIAAAVAIVSLTFLHHAARSRSYAASLNDQEEMTPAAKCANTACNSSCWVDGTHHNPGTMAVKTVRQPNSCPPGTGGCLTQACP